MSTVRTQEDRDAKQLAADLVQEARERLAARQRKHTALMTKRGTKNDRHSKLAAKLKRPIP